MTTYSQTSATIYPLKHNAKRASLKVPGAVLFPDGDGWRWGVPAAEGGEQQAAAPEGAVAVVEPPAPAASVPAYVCPDCGADRPTACTCEAEVEDDRPRHEQLGVDDALIYGDEPRAPLPDAFEIMEAPAPGDLVRAARDQAGVMADASPKVAWLLLEMAKAIEAGSAPAARPVRASVPRQAKAGRDWTVKPIITSATNQGVQRLIDRIDAARGDAAALEAFRFSRSSTYYQMAGNFLDALLAQARGAQQAG